MMLFAAFIVSYITGSMSGSIIISNLFFKEDIRTVGSGNAGATNTFRAYGMKYAVLAFLIDFLKGIFACYISYFLDNDYGQYIAASAVVIGHIFPIYYKFKGGKGMATSVGVNLYHDIFIALLQGILFLLSIIKIQIVSICSMLITFAALIYVLIVHSNNTPFLIYTIINTILVVYAHRSNIVRIIQGKEEKTKRLKG